MSTDAPLTPDFHLLPNDPQLLKQLIADLMVELSKKDGRIEQLQHRMDLLLRRLYGASSEKFDPRQASLFETTPSEPAAAATTESAAENSLAPEPDTSRAASSRPGHGRRKLPDTLKTVEVVHDLTETEKAAMGGAENLVCIGQEETEQVEWEPSCLYRILHIQKKYARKVQLPESGLSLSEKNVIWPESLRSRSRGACQVPTFWPKWQPASSWIISRCIASSGSVSGAAGKSPAPRPAPGWPKPPGCWLRCTSR
jgi:hypothetical protein